MRPNRSIRLIAACITLLASAAASGGLIPHLLYGKRIAGQVVDAGTGQPIAGAHVAYIWRSGIIPSGFTGHNSRDICYHAAATTTDAQGRFDVPSWSKWSTYDVYNVDPVVLVYAPRYEPAQKSLHQGLPKPPTEHLDERYVLKPFSGTVDERMEMLFFGLANQGCDYGKDSKKSLYPILKAIHGEARKIARTREHEGTVQTIAEFAADAGLATNPNSPVDDPKTKAFIEEHLK